MDDRSQPKAAAPGLRERKRAATRLAIQRAALELSTELGFDRVTIDGISAAADVSPRTFFNYFASKDDAIIGDIPTLSGDTAIQEFLTRGPGESIFVGLDRMLGNWASMIAGNKDINQRRRALLRQHPHLFARRMAHLHDVEDQLTEIISQRLASDDAALAVDELRLARRARLISLISFAALRYAYSGWIESGDAKPLTEYLSDSFLGLQEIVARNDPR